MTLSDFIQLMFRYIGLEQKKADFVVYLFSLIIRDPSSEIEEKADDQDNFNPVSGLKPNSLRRIFRGERGIRESAAQFLRIQDKTKFVDAMNELSLDARERLIVELESLGFKTTDELLDEYCADLFIKIIECSAKGTSSVTPGMLPIRDSRGAILANVPSMSAYVKNGKLYVGGDVLDLPIDYVVPDIIENKELPYVNALCEAYADKLLVEIKPSDICTLTVRWQRDFSSQRKAYFSFESIANSLRDVYDDTDNQIEILKEDAYEGIYEVYYRDYDDGYERLSYVLEKITNTTLDKSTLSHIKNLIGNREKKGICHVLINDGKIASWVNVDE